MLLDSCFTDWLTFESGHTFVALHFKLNCASLSLSTNHICSFWDVRWIKSCYTFCLGSINKKKEQKKKKGMSYKELRLPAIVAFSSGGNRSKHKKKSLKKGNVWVKPPSTEHFSLFVVRVATARQSSWDGIVACHRGCLATTTWNYQRCTMGAHRLQPPVTRRDVVATVTHTHPVLQPVPPTLRRPRDFFSLFYRL